jgi:hypothetical protein
MKTVLHIFLKDVWQTRRLLACWLVLLAAQLASSLSANQLLFPDYDILLANGPKTTPWTLLHWLGLVALTFEVLLADRAFGTEPTWKTRPIARWQMALAKFGFISLFLVAMPTAVELGFYVAKGVPLGSAVRYGWMAMLGQAYVVSWMALLALFSRRRGWEVAVLGVLALAAPMGMFVLYGLLHQFLAKLPSLKSVWELGWDRAPDFLAVPETYHLHSLVVMGLLPVVALVMLGCQSYVLQQRARTAQWLGALLLIWLAVPFTLMLHGLANSKSLRDAPVHRFTPQELGLAFDWNATAGRRPFVLLQATQRLPELPTAHGPLVVVEAWWGISALHLTRQLPAGANGFPAHFSLPDMNPRRFSDHVQMPDQSAFVNRALTRTNGALVAWLGQHTVLNPVTLASEPRLALGWEADRPLTNFTHATISLRVATVESECRIVGRMPFAEFRLRHPTTNAEPSDAPVADPRYTITTTSRTTEWRSPSGFNAGDWAATTPRKAVLWHPKRRELLLPTTGNAYKDGNHGVLALAGLQPLQEHTHTSHFPHTPRGKEPQPGAPGPEWFAEAEVIFIALRNLTNQHRIIEVPDVPLPPVPVEGPKP